MRPASRRESLDDVPAGRIQPRACGPRAQESPIAIRPASGTYLVEHDEPGPNEVAIDAYMLVDLAAGWKVTRKVALQLLVRNLFDESYALSTDRRSPVAPGIAGILSARATF